VGRTREEVWRLAEKEGREIGVRQRREKRGAERRKGVAEGVMMQGLRM